ncbi:MAG TPA: PEP-CTERM sorting domain-containing protein [Opitutaceae bacterium]|nr:PEP-CTERM sorting domain-containing protein [Opitutaceae bacterium]
MPLRRRGACSRGILCAFGLCLAGASVAQIVTPSSDAIDWTNPAGWSTSHIPGGTETPQLSTGTVTVSGSVTVGSINLFGGTLTNTGGSGALTITSTGSEWRASLLNSSAGGALTLTIGSSANLLIGTTADHDFDGSAVVNNGSITWSSGRLRSGDGGAFTNNATFNDSLSADTDFRADYGNHVASFNNASTGVYVKSGNAVTHFVDVPFNNSGTVTVNAGTLKLDAGGTIGAGALYNGAGQTLLNHGTFTASGLFSSSNLVLGGDANLAGTTSLGGSFIWTSGTFNNGDTTTIPAGATLQILTGADHDFDAHALINNGTINWTAGRLRSGDGGTFTNNATFGDNLTADTDVRADYGNHAASFNNAAGATYIKSGNSVTQFVDIPFNNAGTVTINTGTLKLDAGGTISAGALYNGAGQTLLNSGTFAASGLFTSHNLVLGGAANLIGNNSLGGGFIWTSGTFNNGDTTTIPLGAILNIVTGADHDFDAHTFINNGDIEWSAGRLRSGDGGSLTNNATFDDNLAADTDVRADYGNHAATFVNAAGGTYFKTGNFVTQFVDIPFNNAGTVTINAGTLKLDAGGTISAGALYNGDGQTLLNGGTFTASGLFTSYNLVLGGNANLAGNTSLGGSFVWTSGTFNNGNTTTIAAGATLQINTGADHDFDAHTFVNNGTVNWNTGRLRSGDGGTFTNNAQFNDNVTVDTDVRADYGNHAASFVNTASGTYFKTGNSVTQFVDIPFNNAGTVTTNAGTLKLDAGGTISAGAMYDGGGVTLLNSGLFTATGLFTSSNLVLGGSASLAGDTSLGGSFTWTSGTFNNGNTTTIPVGATFAITTNADHDFDSHAFVNNGTVQWDTGRLRSGDGGTFTNNGTFNDTVAVGTDVRADYGNHLASFANSATGTYNKSGSATTHFVDIPFSNAGNINVSAGTLQFSSSFIQSGGTLAVSNGAALQFDGGLNLAAGYLIGTGTVTGNVASSGVISPSVGSPSGSAQPGHLNITGDLSLASVSQLIFELGGVAPGVSYDFLNVSGTAALGSATLDLAFTNSFNSLLTGANTFTVLTASSLSGAFGNVANGGRLFTVDGLGSFQVNYGSGSLFASNSVVLSNFTPVPEPSTYALFALGLAALLGLRRRRNSAIARSSLRTREVFK